ncbi:MAG: transglutaminase domain-containing protein [Acidobacteriota bacterium]
MRRAPASPNRDAEVRQRRRRRVVGLLRAGVLASAAVVLCWSLTVATGVAAAALGAVLGALLADRVARSPARLASALVLAAATLAAGAWAARLPVRTAWIADLLGPVTALHLSEAALWLVLAGPAVFALRLLAARRDTLAVLEMVAVAGAAAAGFAAHRDGMVHRPLAVGDWAWSRGLDPAVVFLAIGGLGAFLLAALLVREGRTRRLPLHFAALAVVALALLLVVRLEGLPKPDPAGDLGLTGEPEDGEGGEGQSGGRPSEGGDSNELGDLEWKDDYGDSGEQAPLAVVLLHDDYSPPAGVYYFRQSAFSQYNGRRLVQSTRDGVDGDILHRFPFQPLDVTGAPPTSRERKALATTVGLMVDHVRPFALDSPARFAPAQNPNPMRFQRAFTVRSHVQIRPYDDLLGRRAGDPDWTDDQWSHYTEMPADPRYRALAEELLSYLRPEFADDPLGRALAIKDHLDRNGIYSRKSRHADKDDPAASFLFGDLTGYCVHFAHAAVYLFRGLGLPARVAAGYAVSESDRGGGSTILIRGGNAHAWPEVYLEDVGWVVVDPSPATSLDEPMAAADQRLQQMLGEMMRQQQDEQGFEDQLRQAVDWGAILRRVLALLAVVLAAAYSVKVYRFVIPWLARPSSVPRVGYRAALDRLADVGLRRSFGESRESFARRLESSTPSFDRLTRAHLGWALGSGQRPAAGPLRALVSRIPAELRTHVPLWRRILGVLDPFSWVRVR